MYDGEDILTLDSGRESRLRSEEGVDSCTYPWVVVLGATLLCPKRTTYLERDTVHILVNALKCGEIVLIIHCIDFT